MTRRIHMTTVTAAGLIAGLAMTVMTGCSSSKTANSSASTGPAISGTITVLAAASLTESFTALGKKFEAAHPGTTVKFSFGASSTLAQQINQGAPADVFASASPTNMTQVTTAGNASSPTNFAANVLEIAVPPSNPGNVTSVADLAKASVKVAVCQSQVPCGAIALKLFTKAGITVTPVTEEADVKATLTKVETDEVDAGVVYVTDVRAAGKKVKGITIDASQNVSTEYPIATLSHATNTAGAKAFTAFVLSSTGQTELAADGFAKP